MIFWTGAGSQKYITRKKEVVVKNRSYFVKIFTFIAFSRVIIFSPRLLQFSRLLSLQIIKRIHTMSEEQAVLMPSHKKTLLGQNPNLRILIFQGIGTIILAYGISCSQYLPPLHMQNPNPFHDVFVSLSLYLAIVICGPFCGGHFNPSVSFGFFCQKQKKMGIKTFLSYVVGQIIGAILGALLSKIFYDCEAGPFKHSEDIIKVIGYGIGQLMGTFIFVFIILLVTNEATTFITEASWVHIFIPFTLYFSRKISHKIGGINPAVVIIFQFQRVIVDGVDGITLLYVFILGIGSLLGAFIASRFFENHYKVHLNRWQAKNEAEN